MGSKKNYPNTVPKNVRAWANELAKRCNPVMANQKGVTVDMVRRAHAEMRDMYIAGWMDCQRNALMVFDGVANGSIASVMRDKVVMAFKTFDPLDEEKQMERAPRDSGGDYAPDEDGAIGYIGDD